MIRGSERDKRIIICRRIVIDNPPYPLPVAKYKQALIEANLLVSDATLYKDLKQAKELVAAEAADMDNIFRGAVLVFNEQMYDSIEEGDNDKLHKYGKEILRATKTNDRAVEVEFDVVEVMEAIDNHNDKLKENNDG